MTSTVQPPDGGRSFAEAGSDRVEGVGRAGVGSDAFTLRHRRVRAAATTAAGLVAPSNSLHRFVAQNPHQGLEHLPVEDGLRWAAEESGSQTTWGLARLRDEHSRGAFTRAHALGVLRSAVTDLADQPGVRCAGVDIDADEILVIDLLAGPTSLPIHRVAVLPSEFLDTVRPGLAELIDRYCAQWAAGYLDDVAAWPMPQRDLGVFGAWRRLAVADPNLRDLVGPGASRLIESLPGYLEDIAADALIRCSVDPAETIATMTRALFRVPGWSSAFVRRDGVDGRDVLGWITLRLVVEAALIEPGFLRSAFQAARTAEVQSAASRDLIEAEHQTRRVEAVIDALHIGTVLANDPARRQVARLLGLVGDAQRDIMLSGAFEAAYRDRLLALVSPTATATFMVADSTPTPARVTRPAVQLVCCIDPRSEGLRRHAERVSGGQVETFGFAGFFGLVLQLQDLDERTAAASCPVLLSPDAVVTEVPAHDADPAELAHRNAWRRRRAALVDSWKYTKTQGASAFSLAELAGWVTGPFAAAATVTPQSTDRARRSVERRFRPGIATTWEFPEGMDLVETAASILRGIGLSTTVAPLVVLAGHGSRHRNNAHRAALDCGACGGRHGGDNARIAAALLNRVDVRAGLAERGVNLPDDTVFVAADHETTTDRVVLLDVPLDVSFGADRDALDNLRQWLTDAGDALCAERAGLLPDGVGRLSTAADPAAVTRRAADWAQIVPEWGLLGNAAFIIGPRSATLDHDLDRRVFLHSYEPTADRDGANLAAILGGPAIVAQGINAQYAAAAAHPDRHGAGPKPLHNPVGRLGVLRGPDGDLQTGLPAESVSLGGTALHEPMRLTVVIDAPHDRIDAVIRSNERVGHLVNNGWMHVVGVADGQWALRRRGGGWHSWSPERSTGPGAASR